MAGSPEAVGLDVYVGSHRDQPTRVFSTVNTPVGVHTFTGEREIQVSEVEAADVVAVAARRAGLKNLQQEGIK